MQIMSPFSQICKFGIYTETISVSFSKFAESRFQNVAFSSPQSAVVVYMKSKRLKFSIFI